MKGSQRKTSGQLPEPCVGIFWFADGKLITDHTPVSEAEDYSDCKTHARSHSDVWTKFQQSGTAPCDVEYDEPPRGRVTYNKKSQRFSLFADRCILRDKNVVRGIMSAMNLPIKTTDKGTDPHYRCSVCLHRNEDLF